MHGCRLIFPPCVCGNVRNPTRMIISKIIIPRLSRESITRKRIFSFPSLSWRNAEWLNLKLFYWVFRCEKVVRTICQHKAGRERRTECASLAFLRTVTSKKREREKGKADFRLSFQVEWIHKQASKQWCLIRAIRDSHHCIVFCLLQLFMAIGRLTALQNYYLSNSWR